jgi:hypothetical protein
MAVCGKSNSRSGPRPHICYEHPIHRAGAGPVPPAGARAIPVPAAGARAIPVPPAGARPVSVPATGTRAIPVPAAGVRPARRSGRAPGRGVGWRAGRVPVRRRRGLLVRAGRGLYRISGRVGFWQVSGREHRARNRSGSDLVRWMETEPSRLCLPRKGGDGRRAPRVFRAPPGNNPEWESAATRKKAGGRTAGNKIIGVADTNSNRQPQRELGGKPDPLFGRTVEVDGTPQLVQGAYMKITVASQLRIVP